MPFPSGIPTVLVTYGGTNPAGGTPAGGTVRFAPSVPVIAMPGEDRIFTGSGTYNFNVDGDLVDEDGTLGVRLLPNDLDGMNPIGWLWLVTVSIDGTPTRTFRISLDSSQPEVDLADLEEVDPARADYVPVQGPAGPAGADGTDGAPGSQGPAGADGQDGAPGAAGQSAYQVAQASGFVGSEAQWLASLVGPEGPQGAPGVDGADGEPGPQGDPGPAGADGTDGAQGPKGDTGDVGPQGPQPPLGAAGAGPTVALRSDDPTTTNARTPVAHASSHGAGGSDQLTPAAIGALPAAGGIISGNLAVAGAALGEDKPAAHGIAAWCYDPALAVNSTALVNGSLYLVRVDIAAAVTVTKLYWWVGNSGSSPVTNQNHVGLYSAAGTLLASANADAAVSSAALKTTTITGQALTAGAFYWVGLLFNASVPPTLTRASGWTGVNVAANLGLSAATSRFAINGTGRTSLPSSITPASNVGTDFAGPWVAVGT